MKLVDKNEDFRAMVETIRSRFSSSILILVFLLGFDTLSEASSPKIGKSSGMLKYLPKHITNNIFGLSENIPENNLEDFMIFHSHNFENNTLGGYNIEEKKRDWNIVYDNRQNHPEIVNFDGSKRGRNLYEKGKYAHQTGSDFGGSLNGISNEIYFTYQVFFEPGFDWGKAVKFPGLQMYPTMGAGQGLNPGNGGSTIRFQSNYQGKLRWYVYHHKMTTIYGESLGWDGFQLLPGQWYTITLRIVLNTPGESNGIIQVFVNDQLQNSQSNMMFRTGTSVQNINRQSISTFMGGGDSSFAPSKTQYSWIDNFFVWNYSDAYLKNNPTLARGRTLHPSSEKLVTPLTNIANDAPKLIYGVYPPNSGKIIINN